jgi:hypothetical protein
LFVLLEIVASTIKNRFRLATIQNTFAIKLETNAAKEKGVSSLATQARSKEGVAHHKWSHIRPRKDIVST